MQGAGGSAVDWNVGGAGRVATPTELWCSGWAAAQFVEAIEHEDYGRVARVRLDADRRWWPTPPGPRLGYFGVLERDRTLDPPKGYRWTSPRYSKRR